ncbi:ZrgA family zinc uptake protein [Spongorhabdus nitratireducens]
MKRFSPMAALAASIALSVASLNVSAESGRHADAHIHGTGQLNFAVEGNQVYLELDTPGFDILGFETLATEEQHHKLEQALEQLKQANLWAFTPAASCSLKQVKVSSSAEEHDEHESHASHDDHEDHESHDGHKEDHRGKHDDDHHDKHQEEHHGHDADHGDHKEGHHGHDADHDEHKEGHHDHDVDHEEHKESGHMDISATYVYECSNINKLTSIRTRLFETFEHSEQLKVQGITSKGQMAAVISRAKPELEL